MRPFTVDEHDRRRGRLQLADVATSSWLAASVTQRRGDAVGVPRPAALEPAAEEPELHPVGVGVQPSAYVAAKQMTELVPLLLAFVEPECLCQQFDVPRVGLIKGGPSLVIFSTLLNNF